MDLNPWLAEMMRERRYPFDAMNASVDKKCWIENQSTCEFTVELCDERIINRKMLLA